jgi:hypothetical protein
VIAEVRARVGEDREPCDCRPVAGRRAGCGGFKCFWVEGFGEPRDRPDLLGVVFGGSQRDDGSPLALAWETRPGALESKRVRLHVERFATKVCTVTVAQPRGESEPKVVDVREPVAPVPMTRVRRGRRLSLAERSMRRRSR